MKSKGISAFIIIAMVISCVLGIFAQDMTYYLEDVFSSINYRWTISIITFTSVALCVIAAILFFIFEIKKKRIFLDIIIVVLFLVNLYIVNFALFVWAMWLS